MTASSEGTASNGSRRRVPDFFIVGNPKSGTTALYEMLDRHPQIYMPPLGSQFFAVEQKKHPGTLEEYLALFEPALPEQRAGEISRGYFRSRTAAAAIAELAPGAQIIVVLREPASFLRSLHMELLQDHVETERDFGKAIEREEAKRRAQVTPDTRVEKGLMYSPERVGYVEQLRRFHAVFPREQVLVLIYDDFRSDNEATLRSVLRTLGVDHTVPLEVKDANPTVGVRSARMNESCARCTWDTGRRPERRRARSRRSRRSDCAARGLARSGGRCSTASHCRSMSRSCSSCAGAPSRRYSS